MALAEQHQFQVLTKRSTRMHAPSVLSDPDFHIEVEHWVRMTQTGIPGADIDAPLAWPLPNVWLGVSVEDQGKANLRVHDLLRTPAAVRFVSAEPLLNRINLRHLNLGDGLFVDAMTGFHTGDRAAGWEGGSLPPKLAYLDWLIAGGESGPGARPMHPQWARYLRDQTAIVPCAFLFKQWGEYIEPWQLPEFDDGTDPADGMEPRVVVSPAGGETRLYRVGKKRAGRTLDGRTWDEYPRELAA